MGRFVTQLFQLCLTRSFSRRRMVMDVEKSIRVAAENIHQASAVVVTAGAGMGVDSGLPDFRGPEGFWKAYPPIQRLGLTLPEVSTPEWFENDPMFAWGFFGHRYHLYKRTVPHRGFQILLDWCKSKSDGYFVFTSNVDGHFQKAGFPDDKIVECHGSLQFLQQLHGEGREIWSFPPDTEIDVDESTLHAREPLPRGPPDASLSRQTLARPNVLMFGDFYWVSDRTDQQEYRYRQFINTLQRKKSPFVVIEIGAGLSVPTIRMTSEGLARSRYGTLIRINPREPEVPGADNVSLPLNGLEALERLREIYETDIG